MFYHHCRLFQVFSFVLAHQSRHHEDQMQMCQMKSSSKRSRVKTCSVSISLSFSWAPHCHTCDYTTVLQQPLWIKHCTNHSVSSSFGDLTLNPFFFFFLHRHQKGDNTKQPLEFFVLAQNLIASDEENYLKCCRSQRREGKWGKWLLHPKLSSPQVEVSPKVSGKAPLSHIQKAQD